MIETQPVETLELFDSRLPLEVSVEQLGVLLENPLRPPMNLQIDASSYQTAR